MRTLAAIAVVLGGLALLLVSAMLAITGVLLVLGGLMPPTGSPDAMIPTVPLGIVFALIGLVLGLVGLAAIFRGPRYILTLGVTPD